MCEISCEATQAGCLAWSLEKAEKDHYTEW